MELTDSLNITTSLPDNHVSSTPLPLPKTTSARDTTTKGVDPSTGASAGLAGAVLFVIVVIVIVVMRKRMKHRKQRRKSYDVEFHGRGSESEDSEEDVDEEKERMMRQKSTMSEDSFKFPMWKQVDDKIKAVVGDSLIATTQLTLGSVLGKAAIRIIVKRLNPGGSHQVSNMASLSTTLLPPSKPTPTPDNGGMMPQTTSEKAGAGMAGAGLFVIVIIVVICMRKRCSRHEDDDSTISKRASSRAVSWNPDGSYDEDEEEMLKEVLTEEERLWNSIDVEIRGLVKSCMLDVKSIVMGRMLGKGQFGMVYEASLSKEPRLSNDYGDLTHQRVAVKTLKGSNIDKDTIEAFLKEGMIMKDLRHKHVLTLIGVALGDHGIPMIVLPYMANGNLKKYVGRPDLTITVRELLSFGAQVAEGMKYLGEQKFVHRDLAARNCMLDEKNVVKVADFGLSRDIYTKEYYCSEDKHAKLPVKWMALESIATSKYTTKSDVWSYGVLLWELMTRGGTPYPDVANWDVHQYIKQGRRMAQPPICPDSIYAIMTKCWLEDPNARPTFPQIITLLNDILHPRTKPQSQACEDEKEEDEDEDDGSPNYINLGVNVQPGETQ